MVAFPQLLEYATDRIHVLLQGSIDHHLRGLAKPGINDFHTRIPEGRCDHFGATVMTVQSYFSH